MVGTAFSLVAHVGVFLVLLAIATEPPRSRQIMLIPMEVGSPDDRVTPYLMPAPAGRPAAVPRAQATTGLGAQVLPEPQPATRPSVPEVAQTLERPLGVDSAVPAILVPPKVTTRRLLRPGYGDGRLWIPPVDVLQLGRVLPRAPTQRPVGVGKIDSLLTARLLAFLDSMPPDSFARPRPAPWTTQIAGQTWGIDGSWIYLGPLKLPAALLAFLPLPQGNYDAAKAAADLQHMREDILQAAQHAANAAEFNRYVRELRQRKEREREAARRVPRDTIIP